jgi:hypothetical protein
MSNKVSVFYLSFFDIHLYKNMDDKYLCLAIGKLKCKLLYIGNRDVWDVAPFRWFKRR